MRPKSFVARVLAAGALLAFAAPQASAHEKWFHGTQSFPLRWDLFLRPLPLAFFVGILLVTTGLALWWRLRGQESLVPGPESLGASHERRSALYGVVPLILGLHVAVPLLVSGVQGHLFSPDNILPGAWKYLLGLAETGVALALFYGALTRVAAGILAALWVIGVFLLGLQPMLDNVFYLGFAAFFFCAGRGPLSIDRLLLPRLEPSQRMMTKAVPALRIGLGLSLIVVAFTEKLANQPLALAFLKDFPLNFTPAFGIPMSNDVFILCAGAVELLVGLCILFGVFPREIVLIAWIPINMTLTVFNWTELVGHLPIYGTMAVLLVWTAGPENVRLWCKGLRDGPLPIQSAPETARPTFVPALSRLAVGVLAVSLAVTCILAGRTRVAARSEAPMPAMARDDHSDGHIDPLPMPTGPTSGERAIFLTPGGQYTAQDIRANHAQVPAETFRGLITSHNRHPAKGDWICPITRTQANKKVAWTIDGKRYLFCCPACVAEFVKQAKTAPGSIPPPETFVQP